MTAAAALPQETALLKGPDPPPGVTGAPGAALQALDLLFELLIVVLQLLHLAGEIADRFLKAFEAGYDIARRVLRVRGLLRHQARKGQHKHGREAAHRLKHGR